MPQIAKRPFMAPHNGHARRRRQEDCQNFSGFGGQNLALA
jgi:hypothetical protein